MRSFLIDIKGNEPQDGTLLASRLSLFTAEQRSRLIVYGQEGTLSILRERLPDLRAFSTSSIINCLTRYIAYGWTGMVPSVCNKSPLFVPVNVAPWLWGWPNRFIERLESQGSTIVVMGRLGGPDFPAGIDTLADFGQLPEDYGRGIWTNEVELIRTVRR
jgi:glycerophosphoryl diester phosphodiesterase